MSRVSVAERAKLSTTLAGIAMRRVTARLGSHAVLRWRFLSPKNDRLTIAPQDLRTPDPTRAAEIYAGRFAFAGKIVICEGRSPFETQSPSEEWSCALLGFGWLRHLRAADSTITRANARALVDEWIHFQGAYHPLAWRPDVLSRRIMAWLCHSPLLLTDADVNFYRRFMRSLCRQVRYLRRHVKSARTGRQQLQALMALCFASLCIAGQGRHQRAITRLLVEELDRQIFPDGGHISRNPHTLVDILLDLLPLRQAFSSSNIAPPQPLLNAIDRVMPMVRFFRHDDGKLALFNGMGPTKPELVATVLAYDDARGTPFSNASFSGYQRLQAGSTVALVDAGLPPPLAYSHEAHAGCLSFELSQGPQHIVVNCGIPANNRQTWRQVARATAAHSTVTLNDTSSCHFLESASLNRLMRGAPIIAGPTLVEVNRDDRADMVVLRGSHNGYASRYQIIHHRELRLRADGARLDGDDSFSPADQDTLPDEQDDFAVRFHLHPSIKANRLSDGHGVMLTLPNRGVWTFSAFDNQVELEESVFLAGSEGPRRTTQIVIYGQARRVAQIRWSFAQIAPTSGERRGTDPQPELPL